MATDSLYYSFNLTPYCLIFKLLHNYSVSERVTFEVLRLLCSTFLAHVFGPKLAVLLVIQSVCMYLLTTLCVEMKMS